jgi:hypothetical protein
MAANEPLKRFGHATLKELIEESRRLVKQSKETRKRFADLEKAIDERPRTDPADHAPPPDWA